MITLSAIDYTVIIVYLLVIVLVSVVFRASKFHHMFGEDRKPGWLLLAASLLMIEWSPMSDMMSMGLIIENGYSGIWILKSRFWLAGVPAILYATMWSRLKFQTDNELIRLRYYGTPGIFLHIFRGIFLAVFVIPLFASFIILALRKLLHVLQIDFIVSSDVLLICGVLLLVLKNSFHQKIRTDSLNALLCLAAPVIICFFLLKTYGGPAGIYGTLNVIAENEIRLIPSIGESGTNEAMVSFMVFIFIQWWSVNIVDNSDPNAQRHLQAKNQYAAFRTLFIPILVTSLMFLFVSTIWDCGLLEYKLGGHETMDREAWYLQISLQHLPSGFRAIALLAIIFSFITTLESIINWGGGLLVVDIFKTYLFKEGSDAQYKYLSFFAMLMVSSLALLFAYKNEMIVNLQKFIFSISAGVAPVFLLRWFWWRINAWTQIAAMLSSLVYTLIYDYLYLYNAYYRQMIDGICAETALSQYPLKIIILTLLVVCTWLLVMFFTKPDNKEHLLEFVSQTGTGGIWPEGFPETNYHMKKRLFLCFIFAVTYVLPFFFIWQFKFGSLVFGLILLGLFPILAIYVFKSMSALLLHAYELPKKKQHSR